MPSKQCKLTYVAFVWLFSIVHFHMLPKIAITKWLMMTLDAFVWLFSTVRFHMLSKIDITKWLMMTLLALFDFPPPCVFTCFPKLTSQNDSWWHCLHCLTFLHRAFSHASKIAILKLLMMALVAFVWLFPTVLLHAFQNCYLKMTHDDIGCICLLFSFHCSFWNAVNTM